MTTHLEHSSLLILCLFDQESKRYRRWRVRILSIGIVLGFPKNHTFGSAEIFVQVVKQYLDLWGSVTLSPPYRNLSVWKRLCSGSSTRLLYYGNRCPRVVWVPRVFSRKSKTSELGFSSLVLRDPEKFPLNFTFLSFYKSMSIYIKGGLRSSSTKVLGVQYTRLTFTIDIERCDRHYKDPLTGISTVGIICIISHNWNT